MEQADDLSLYTRHCMIPCPVSLKKMIREPSRDPKSVSSRNCSLSSSAIRLVKRMLSLESEKAVTMVSGWLFKQNK
jgi:hypothetical protein